MARPNILLITCDQYRFPRFSYGPDAGFAEPLKQILGFQGEVDDTNPYAKFFPGLLRLRQNAVVLRNHSIAASACTPSRTVIYTGQYGTKTGVTQTDGLFKNGDSPNFPWLAADGIPTLGTWLRAAGYSTHYFGKWHVSNPPDHSLDAYGFDDWELSYPEPHGSQSNNLGLFRDAGFTDSACAFIRRQGLAIDYDRAYASMAAENPDTTGPDPDDIPPWFAVASFTNPHDIATYPGVISQALPDPDSRSGTQSLFGPLTVPLGGAATPPPVAGTMQIPLNPLGFPQDCASASPTQNESLADKPTCQHEAAYKVGLALAAKLGFNIVNGLAGAAPPARGGNPLDTAVALSLQSCIPFQLADDPQANCVLFLQLYAWLHSVVDKHVDAVLTALEDSGQAGNTIVLFLADHGEYGAAHGMMIEKWYTAYQEALHVPVVVRFPGGDAAPAQLDALTSHIDILPTVLGFAQVTAEQRLEISAELTRTRPVPPLPGVDLAPIIENALAGGADMPVIEPDGEVREGVLFITDDEITAPLPPEPTVQDEHSDQEFAVYQAVVEAVREGEGKGPVALSPGAVKQPNHVRCVRTRDYKLTRYFDPSGEAPQEWEMYDLADDPNEAVNLVEVAATPPQARADLPDAAAVQAAADRLAELLAKLEARDL
jgi:arylsulfatase A-like enzyme